MSETASERLAARCRRMVEEEGLVDIKFVVGDLEGATVETLCEEVEGMFEAYARGECRPLCFNDSRGLRPR